MFFFVGLLYHLPYTCLLVLPLVATFPSSGVTSYQAMYDDVSHLKGTSKPENQGAVQQLGAFTNMHRPTNKEQKGPARPALVPTRVNKQSTLKKQSTSIRSLAMEAPQTEERASAVG